MKLSDLIIWSALVIYFTGNTDYVLGWFDSKIKETIPAQTVVEPKPAPSKKDPNDIQSTW